MNRREFLAFLAALQRAEGGEPIPVQFRRQSPFEAYRAKIAAGSDEFAGEAEAMRLAAELKRRDPAARYYVLPDNVVRYERKLEGEYRVGHVRVRRQGGEIAGLDPLWETTARSAAPLFRDVTAQSMGNMPAFRDHLRHGIPYWRGRLDSACGIDVYGNNGIAVADVDNDGTDEIYVCQPGGLPNRLLKRGPMGTFVDITERSGLGLLDDTASALFADFRNSGVQDCVVLRAAGPMLFLNRGGGVFEEQRDAFRFRTPAGGTFTGMAAADYDRDGKLDLYLCSYVYFQSAEEYRYPAPYFDARNGPPNFLFRNRLEEAGGYFEDTTAEAGLAENNDRFSFAAAWCDYDGDGWPDLYVANDFGRNNLYRNRQGKFRDVARESGVDDPGPGMSAAWFDYNGDGRPDLYVANMWSDAGQRVAASERFAPMRPQLRSVWRGHTKGNSLYRQTEAGRFEAAGESERVEMGRWAWCADGCDWDNDGAPEIFIACGMITNPGAADVMSFFWRQVVARTPMEQASAPAYEEGWNAINQFIREDASWNGHEPNVFYARQDGHYVDASGISGLDYAGDCRAFAITDLDGDGRLDLIVKGRLGPQVRIFLNQCAGERQRIGFRLEGVRSNRDAIGARVEADGQVKFVQAGSGFLSQHSKVVYFGLNDRKTVGRVVITWPSGERQEFHGLEAGFLYDVREGEPRPGRGAFAKQWVPRKAEPATGRNAPVFEPTWLLEPVPLPDARTGGPLLVLTAEALRADADLAARYSLLRRYLFDWRTELEAPLAFLLDGRGRAIRVYPSVPTAEEVAADEKLAARHRELALPFKGRYATPVRRSYYRIAAAYYLAGYPDEAARYFQAVIEQNPANDKALTALGRIDLEAGRLKPAVEWLRRATAANPRSFDAWTHLGGAAFQAEDARGALEHYQKALELRPGSSLAMVNAAQAYSKLGRDAQAEQLLRKAAEADPRDPEPWSQLGLLAARQGRNAEAKAHFQQAITLKKDDAGAINNLGVLYMQMGQPDDAEAAFEYGIRVAPDDDTLYLNLARVQVSRGRKERAREVIGRWLERKPGNAAAQKALRDLEAR